MSGQNFKVFSFRRWSKASQTEGDSEERQDDGALAICAKRGWSLDEKLTDPGKSAYRGQHMQPGGSLWRFFDMLRKSEVRPGDVLLFEGWDRFSRQPVDIALPLFLELISAGVIVITTFDDVEYSKASIRRNSGLLHSTLAAMDAAWRNSHEKGKRVRSAWKKRRDAKTLVCPAWVRPTADVTAYELIPERAAVIERIFKLAVAGHGVMAIAKILNKDTKPFTRHTLATTKERRKQPSCSWHHSYIRTLLTDRRVLGEAEFFEWIMDDHGEYARQPNGKKSKMYPAAVSEKLWQQAQDHRPRNNYGNSGGKMSNLFGAGLSKCACGASMHFVRKGTKSTYTYLQCDSARHGGGCEAKKLHRYEPIEEFVLAYYGALAHGDIKADEGSSSLRTQMGNAQREADDIEAEYNRLAEAVGKGKAGGLAAKRLAKLEDDHTTALDRLRELEKALGGLQAAPVADRLRDVQSLIASMDKATAADRVAIRSRINTGLAGFIDALVFNIEEARPGDIKLSDYWVMRIKPHISPMIPMGGVGTVLHLVSAVRSGNATITKEKGGVRIRFPAH